MLREQGTEIREEKIALDELVAGIRSGVVSEIFACGTAAVVTPITRLTNDDFDVELPVGEKTKAIHAELTGIQMGHRPDPYNWLYRLA